MKESNTAMTVFNVIAVVAVLTIIFFVLVKTETFLLTKTPCEIETSKLAEASKSLSSRSTDEDAAQLLAQFYKANKTCMFENP